jgi:hypothetical protein
MAVTPFRVAAAVAGVLALASVALPFAPVYDPWAWLVWGREVVELDLDTTGGPSWKPLPVVFTAGFALAGDAAPALWLIVARAGWLLAPILAWRIASRLAPADEPWSRPGAGAIAAAGVVLLSDPVTSWMRQFAGGLSEPLLVALVLAAIDRQLARHPGQALALGAGAALLRPEGWPFLAVYAAWLWGREPARRSGIVAVAVAVPTLWLLPDAVGSGDPLTGAGRARGAPSDPVEALGHSLGLVLAALWAGAGWAVVSALQRRQPSVPILAVGAVAWIALVVVMSAVGYAGLPRFAAPAAAVVCVLGAVGFVDLARRARLAAREPGGFLGARAATGVVVVAAAAVAVTGAAQGAVRAADIPGALRQAGDFGSDVSELFDLIADTGRDESNGCGEVATTDLPTQTALAWRLERPLGRVVLRTSSAPRRGIGFVLAPVPSAAARAIEGRGVRFGEEGPWSVYAISCAARASSASDRAIAGVVGARR